MTTKRIITPEKYLELYEKYVSGNCTAEEEQHLFTYQDIFRMQHGNEFDLSADEEHVRARVYDRIVQQISAPETKVRSINLWWRVAAVLVMAIATGLLFYTNRKPAHQQVTAQYKTQKHHQIIPGKSTAILTLANGSVIQLDKAGKGLISTAGKTIIKKMADGKVVYENNSRENLSAAIAMNTISIPRGGQYQLVLPDGTHVWLNAESSLTYPTAFAGKERHVELKGEAYFEVSKNKNMPFRVTSNGVNIEVLGTHFNMMAYEGNPIKTTLLEGSVRLSNQKESVILKPGEQGQTNQNAGQITVKKVDLQEVIGWKNGYFIFHDQNIRDIMDQVSRWYDVDVVYKGNLNGKSFGGIYSRQKDITELINGLELTGLIHFKIDGRRILVMP